MNAADVLALGLPWLRLDLRCDPAALMAEAEAVEARAVPHRANGRGWRSLCLHGLGATATCDATEYGYESEAAAPHAWTEIADLCPRTAEWVGRLPLRRLYRVRYMWLAPGGYVALHDDSEIRRLGPINVALSQPVGCVFKMEGHGVVPFEPGAAFLLDVSNRHAVINTSREGRLHVIVRGEHHADDPAWADLVMRSWRAER
jgi:hypothetical protein